MPHFSAHSAPGPRVPVPVRARGDLRAARGFRSVYPPAQMNTTRIPLADNPNAANSPRRVALASKRGRAQLAENEDYISPPKKKQHLETTAASFRRAQKISLHEPEGRVFAQRRANAPQSQFQRKLLATQEGRQVSQVRVQARHVEQPVQSKEQIQNWRRHYRRVFPSYVFYFEGLAPEAAYKSKRLLLHLGAVCVF